MGKKKKKEKSSGSGISALEYSLLAAIMVLVFAGAFSALGFNMESVFQQLTQNLPAIN